MASKLNAIRARSERATNDGDETEVDEFLADLKRRNEQIVDTRDGGRLQQQFCL